MKKQKPPHWRDWGLRIIRKAHNKSPLRRYFQARIENEILSDLCTCGTELINEQTTCEDCEKKLLDDPYDGKNPFYEDYLDLDER